MISIPRNKVAIIPIRDPDKIGHIWVPDVAKERVDQGIVKYVGPECQHAKVGMYVIFSGYSGTLVHISDPERPNSTVEELIILNEDFVYGEIVDFPQTDVPGLYFKTRDGEYFEATYEMAMTLIAKAFSFADWRQWNPVTRQGLNVVTPRPRNEEYDQMRGG